MKYSFVSPVRFSEVDQDAVLAVPSLVNYFQDAASLQSEALGIGTRTLADRGQGWLLLSWQIVIDHLPRIAQKVKTTTWGYQFRHMMALRNFTMTGEDGEPFAHANSQWMLFDFREMKPVFVPEEDQRLYDPEPRLDMNYVSGKIRPPKGAQPEVRDPFRVDVHHLDTNHHVNNGRYIQMAMAAAADVEPGRVSQLRAEYRSQALLGDEITPVVYRAGEVAMISLEDGEGKSYCTVELTLGR